MIVSLTPRKECDAVPIAYGDFILHERPPSITLVDDFMDAMTPIIDQVEPGQLVLVIFEADQLREFMFLFMVLQAQLCTVLGKMYTSPTNNQAVWTDVIFMWEVQDFLHRKEAP